MKWRAAGRTHYCSDSRFKTQFSFFSDSSSTHDQTFPIHIFNPFFSHLDRPSSFGPHCRVASRRLVCIIILIILRYETNSLCTLRNNINNSLIPAVIVLEAKTKYTSIFLKGELDLKKTWRTLKKSRLRDEKRLRR